MSLLFLLNGVSMAALVPRYPEIVRALELSNTEFGLAIGLGPVGGLLAGLGAASLMKRLGSGRVAVYTQLLTSSAHALVYISPSWLWLVLALAVAAGADAITDVAMNTQGMRVERRYGRSIINSYHAFWSLGAVIGGVIGASAAQIGMPLWLQGVMMLVLLGVPVLIQLRYLLTGPDGSERISETDIIPAGSTQTAVAPEHAPRSTGPQVKGMALRSLALVMALGMILIFAGSTEDAGATWGALYMTSAHDATPFVAGLAFVALQGTQMVGRFTGDAISSRLGDRSTARLGSTIAIVGMTAGLLLPGPLTSILGFAAAGWGVATLFPAAYRAADDVPGLPEGVGLTIVGWIARMGFFLAPPILGFIADWVTLERALWAVPIYALGILMFSSALESKPKNYASQSRAGHTQA